MYCHLPEVIPLRRKRCRMSLILVTDVELLEKRYANIPSTSEYRMRGWEDVKRIFVNRLRCAVTCLDKIIFQHVPQGTNPCERLLHILKGADDQWSGRAFVDPPSPKSEPPAAWGVDSYVVEAKNAHIYRMDASFAGARNDFEFGYAMRSDVKPTNALLRVGLLDAYRRG